MTFISSRILALLACGQSHIDTLLSNISTLSGKDIVATSCIIGGFWLIHRQNIKIEQLNAQLAAQNSTAKSLTTRFEKANNTLLNHESSITLLNTAMVNVMQENKKSFEDLGVILKRVAAVEKGLETHNQLFKELFARPATPQPEKAPAERPPHEAPQSIKRGFFPTQQTNIFSFNHGLFPLTNFGAPPFSLRKT